MDRKTAVREQIKTLRDVIDEKTAENSTIVGEITGHGTDESPLDGDAIAERKSAFQANRFAIDEARDALEMILETEEAKGYRDRLDAILADGGPRGNSAALAAQAGQVPAGAAAQFKGLGQAFVESDAFQEMKSAGLLTMGRPFAFEGDLGAQFLAGFMARKAMGLSTKDVYSDLPTGTPGSFGSVQRDALVPQAMRSTRVRDLFPVQPTTAALIEYFRVTGFTNNASVVPERDSEQDSGFGRKPQSSLTFQGEQAPIRTIAHWEAAHRNVLADEPQLAGLIETELLYGLRLVEDDQILNGTGSGQDLEGIRNVTGVQTYDWSDGEVGDNKADAVRRAMTLALLAYYEPTGVVLHDTDWEDMELLKDDEGRYLLALSIALGGEKRVWRAPVVTTPAMDAGAALVGAFGLGATLYDRETANVRISEHHANFFIENAVAVLAEERLGLATKRPQSFVEVTFDEAPS